MLAPIALFVYNRPEHTRRTIEALQQNEMAGESVLHVFADGPKMDASMDTKCRIDEVRAIVNDINGFKEVHLHLSVWNKGCARSVREGVTEIVEHYERAIVVEDDIVTCPQFLSYMNEALDMYANDHRIWSIGGNNINISLPENYLARHDTYLAHRTCSWGWATWADRWHDIDWEVKDAFKFFADLRAIRRFERGGEGMAQMLRNQLEGKIDAWDIVWDYHIYKHNGFCLRPVKALAYNIGMDGSGTHYKSIDNPVEGQAPLFNPKSDTLHLEPHIRPNREVQRIFYNYWSDTPILPWKTTVKRNIKKLLRQCGLMKQPQA